MSDIKIGTRRVGKYINVDVCVRDVVFDLGILDESELLELANDLRGFAYDIHPESEPLDAQAAIEKERRECTEQFEEAVNTLYIEGYISGGQMVSINHKIESIRKAGMGEDGV